MEQELNGRVDRRDFMSLAAVAAALGVGAALPAATVSAATDGPATDFTRWLDSIPGKQRALLDMREPNGGLGMAWRGCSCSPRHRPTRSPRKTSAS